MNPQSCELLQAESPSLGRRYRLQFSTAALPCVTSSARHLLTVCGYSWNQFTAGTSLQPCFTLQLQTLRRFQTRFLNKHAWVREGLHHFHALKIGFRPTSFSLQIFMKIQLHPSYNSSPSFKENTSHCTMVPLLLFTFEKQ